MLADDVTTQATSISIAGVFTILPTVTCAAVLGYLLLMGVQIKFKICRGRFYIERDKNDVKDLAKSLEESFTLVAGISTERIAVLLLYLADFEACCLRNVELALRSEVAARWTWCSRPSGSPRIIWRAKAARKAGAVAGELLRDQITHLTLRVSSE